jgi:RNA polymerase sigma-70 factor (ECF subfamily)
MMNQRLKTQMSVDPGLIRRVREGDVAAFEQLFNSHQKRVYNLIYRMVGNDQDAADLTQEVFVRIYSARHRLQSEEAFGAYIRTIATNLCRDHFRKVKRRVKADSLDEPISVDGGEVEKEVADWSTNPERTLEKKDLQAAVQGALDTLSDEHRAVVVLHHIEGMDLKEISQELGIPEGTVKSRLARARDELKRKLGHYVA